MRASSSQARAVVLMEIRDTSLCWLLVGGCRVVGKSRRLDRLSAIVDSQTTAGKMGEDTPNKQDIQCKWERREKLRQEGGKAFDLEGMGTPYEPNFAPPVGNPFPEDSRGAAENSDAKKHPLFHGSAPSATALTPKPNELLDNNLTPKTLCFV